MLREVYTINHATLRYFNVAGADPNGRTGQSSIKATHLIKIAVQPRSRNDPAWIFFVTTIPPLTVPVCVIMST